MRRLMVFLMLAGLPATALAQPGRSAFGDFDAALSNARTEVTELKALLEVSVENVKVVEVGALAGDDRSQSLSDELATNASAVDVVRAAILLSTIEVAGVPDVDGGTTLGNVLISRGIAPREVVALDVTGQVVTVFYLERERTAIVVETDAGP